MKDKMKQNKYIKGTTEGDPQPINDWIIKREYYQKARSLWIFFMA